MAASVQRIAIRQWPRDVDRYVGARLRDRRIMLGITQQEMAAMIGVTYQQAHKYERGLNRIAVGRLYAMAQALGVKVGYFFEGVDAQPNAITSTPQQQLFSELARNFVSISDRRQQEAVCNLARSLANPDRAAPEASNLAADGEVADSAS